MSAGKPSPPPPENETHENKAVPARILIVAGSEALRNGLRDMLVLSSAEGLEPTPDLHVVGQISGEELREAPSELYTPDLVLIAVNETLKVTSLDLIAGSRHHYPTAKIMLLTDLSADAGLADYLQAGASGLFPLDLDAAELVQAVGATLVCGLALHPDAISVIGPQFVRRSTERQIALTDQQREVLLLIAEGDTNAEIAGALGVAEDTAAKYVSRLLRRLNARNRTAAVAHALRWGLIE